MPTLPLFVHERLSTKAIIETLAGHKKSREEQLLRFGDPDHSVTVVREAIRCHLNYVVADTRQWEQSAAYRIDRHGAVAAFVKNAGLGFAIPYIHNGERHDYIPDFLIRPKGDGARYLILEVKGFDELVEVKTAAARRWVSAVNADRTYGEWNYAVARKVSEVSDILDAFLPEPTDPDAVRGG